MDSNENYPIRDGLIVRRRRLEKAIASAPGNQRLEGLLHEVESALERFDKGTYGLCDVCHEPIEPERLAADPTICICLDHLSPDQQRALEDDLAVARAGCSVKARFPLISPPWHWEGQMPTAILICAWPVTCLPSSRDRI